MADRLPFALTELRSRTVRGVGVNAVFLVVVEVVSLAQGLIVARVLGPSQVGLYGIVSITAMTLIALKRVGIDEAYVQQEEADQEVEFQKAFTLELGLSVLFTVLIAIAAPILVAVYDDDRLLALTLAVSYLPLAFALQAPLWIFFRRMDFVRQRSLQAVVPLVTFVVTIPLVLAGVGVWSLVIGAFAGNLAAVVMSIRLSPYRLKLRYDRATALRYFAFSWPIFVVTAGGLIIGQGQILVFKLDGGLVAAGFLSLAVALTRYADRADQIISPAIYPAICAVHERTRTLEELFVKSCRASAVWSVAFGAGFVLFAPDLVHFALGSKWDGAVILLQGLAVTAALYQLGFGWIAFARGMGRPRPPAVEAVVAVTVFLLAAVPALFLWGRGAYVGAMIASSVAVLAVRAYFVRRLLPGVDIPSLVLRCVRPLVPAVAVVVAIRLVIWGGQRHLAQAVGEVLAFLCVYAWATWVGERELVRELREPALQP
ncbi:MAG: oligosaccharide flippase family protein [Gaiellaceae bacterium]